MDKYLIINNEKYYLVFFSIGQLPYVNIDTEKSIVFLYSNDFTKVYYCGKKNKLNKIDIVGFFSQKGKLEKGDLGLIEVKDFISFAAVKFNKVKDLLQNVRDEKMKGKKFKIEVARKVIKKEE
jgi:hypothetical protein